jgi:hypothetical protein
MTEARKPFLIRMLTLLYGFAAAVTIIMTSMAVLGRGGRYSIDGDEVTQAEFIARAVPWLIVVALVAGFIAWAFWSERAWARHAFVALWVVVIATADVRLWEDPAIDADEVFVTVFSLVMVLPVVWYFYLKRGVVAYYRALARREASHAP